MASEKTYMYDVAISYAGEDRPYAESLAHAFRSQGLKIFYDRYEISTLWGKNLYDYLSDLYQHKAHYCVMLLSQYYSAKVWTNHEREAAQNRAVREKEEYILPIRLDSTEIPGHLQTLVYLDWNDETVETITTAILEKLGKTLQTSSSSEVIDVLAHQKEEMHQQTTQTRTTPPIVQQIGKVSPFIAPLPIEKLEVLQTLTGHTESIHSIALSADGKTLVSGSSDRTIKVWILATGKAVRTLTDHRYAVYSVTLSADGKTLVSGSYDNTIKVWNLTTGKAVHTLRDHTSSVKSIVLSTDGQGLVSGSWDRTVKVWNLTTGKAVRTLIGHTSLVNSVALSADGQTLVSGSSDNTIKVWNLATGQELRTLRGHESSVSSVALSADGQTLVSGSWDHTIKVWGA